MKQSSRKFRTVAKRGVKKVADRARKVKRGAKKVADRARRVRKVAGRKVRKVARRGAHHVRNVAKQSAKRAANVFTFFNVSLGFLSILAAFKENYGLAVTFMLVAAICDLFDGKIARLARSDSLLGLQLDSLADIVAFGAAPAIFGYMHNDSLFAVAAYVIFLCCGTYRLARFNIQKTHGYYVGMPIPVNVLMVAGIYFGNLPVKFWPYVYLVFAFLMISKFKVKKFL